MADISVADAIEQLRIELVAALTKSQDQSIQFLLEGVELELAISAKQEGGLSAKVKWLVVQAGIDTKIGSEQRHKVKLKLNPVQRSDDGKLHRLKVSDTAAADLK